MASTTTQSEAPIRRVEKEDEKFARFMIGQANMELLVVANRRVYSNPFAIAIWVAISSIFVHVMHWWPNGQHGLWSYLRPLPAFTAMAVPLMFLIEWQNRPYFEQQMQDVLHGADMADVIAYYNRSPYSGIWMLTYQGDFIGLIAIDASDSSPSPPRLDVNGNEKKKQKKSATSSTTITVARLRHFYFEERYRLSKAQDDLVHKALQHVFRDSSPVESVVCMSSPLSSWLGDSLRRVGFRSRVDALQGPKLGILKWQASDLRLDRADWERQNHN